MAIVSHQHRFIFLKTRKTAGTSFEIALSAYCGPRDIITPVSRNDEKLRRELGYRGPQNYRDPLWTYRWKNWQRLWKKHKWKGYRNHMPAVELRDRLGQQTWTDYYTFCFERNPWDKAVSSYFWSKRHQGEQRSLENYILEGAYVRHRGWKQYTIDGTVAVDNIYRYEDLPDAAAEIAQRFGFSGPLQLPHAKAGHRVDRRPYWEVLSSQAASHIAENCAPEIELMGYRFKP